jgi:hypothetical protein
LGAVDAYIEKNGEDGLVNDVINKREGFLKKLIQDKPEKYKKFENGWKNRLNALRQQYGKAVEGLNPLGSPAYADEIPMEEGVRRVVEHQQRGGRRCDGSALRTGHPGYQEPPFGACYRTYIDIEQGAGVRGSTIDVDADVLCVGQQRKGCHHERNDSEAHGLFNLYKPVILL